MLERLGVTLLVLWSLNSVAGFADGPAPSDDLPGSQDAKTQLYPLGARVEFARGIHVRGVRVGLTRADDGATQRCRVIVVVHNRTREWADPSFHLQLWDETGLLAKFDYTEGPCSSAGLGPGMVKRAEGEVLLPEGATPSRFAVTPLPPAAVTLTPSRPETPAEAEARLRRVLAETSSSILSHLRSGIHLPYLAGTQPVESREQLMANLVGQLLRTPRNFSGQLDVRSLSQAWRNRQALQAWAIREYWAAATASEMQERALRLLADMYIQQDRRSEAAEMLSNAASQAAWRSDIVRQLRAMQ